jgi:hypothetical protein
MSTWTPIAEAPKNGEELVVTDFTGPPEFASWKQSDLYEDGGFWSNRDNRRREMPTHFLQLPPAIVPPAKGRTRRASAKTSTK